MWTNLQFPTDFVTFTQEILNGKLDFLCSVPCALNTSMTFNDILKGKDYLCGKEKIWIEYKTEMNVYFISFSQYIFSLKMNSNEFNELNSLTYDDCKEVLQKLVMMKHILLQIKTLCKTTLVKKGVFYFSSHESISFPWLFPDLPWKLMNFPDFPWP